MLTNLYLFICSQRLLVLISRSERRDYARVAGLEWSRMLIKVLVGRNELSLVVCASVTNHDLRGVLVGHDNGWLWKSASEGVWMISLQWLLQHASVKVLSDFKMILG